MLKSRKILVFVLASLALVMAIAAGLMVFFGEKDISVNAAIDPDTVPSDHVRLDGTELDVTKFGATPDDASDDTGAVAKAIEAAGEGGIIYFPRGVYCIDSGSDQGLPLKSNISLVGADGAILKCNNDENFVFTIRNKTNITFDNLGFYGKGVGITDNSSYITIKHCEVTNTGFGAEPTFFGFYLNNVNHFYFLDNYSYDNKGHVFMGYDVSESEFRRNRFINDSEPIHLVGQNIDTVISNNTLHHIGRIGIEIQDNGSGMKIEENDIRYMEEGGIYGISFAAPQSENAFIRNNILVAGTKWNWGAGIEVMGKPVIEQNVIYGWVEGMQFNLGFHPGSMEAELTDGALVQNNLLRNQTGIGLMKVECGDTLNIRMINNFIENPQLDGIHLFWDRAHKTIMEGNVIVRDAGFWPDDNMPYWQRDIERYGDENWYILPVRQEDGNGLLYHNTSHFAGIRFRGGADPAGIIRNNRIIQRNAKVPEGFTWEGIVFDEGVEFQNTLVEGNHIISFNEKPEGLGVNYLLDNALERVSFNGNYFINLNTVLKKGATGKFAAAGNTALDAAEQGAEGIIQDTAGDKAPLVEAGPDQTIVLPETCTLEGKVTDDRSGVEVLWEKFAGPGEVKFSSEKKLKTRAAFSQPGWYVLKLKANDGVNEAWDVVLVQVAAENTTPKPLPSSEPAGSLPSGWGYNDVRMVYPAGTAVEEKGTFTVKGGNGDLHEDNDAFNFVYRKVSGDCSIVSRVADMENTDAGAKAGVIIRERLHAWSLFAAAVVTPGEGILSLTREAAEAMVETEKADGGAPKYLKVERKGDAFASYCSDDGKTWTQIGRTKQLTMEKDIYIGLAVTSHKENTLCTANFDHIAVTGQEAANVPFSAVTPAPEATPVPEPTPEPPAQTGSEGQQSETGNSGTAPEGMTFVKGINFNGIAVTIEGNKWLSYEEALKDGLSTTKKMQLAKTSCTIEPKADAHVDAMLNSGIWFRGNWGLKQTLENGEYGVYLWIMENYSDHIRYFGINLEEQVVEEKAGTLPLGNWKRYGPYNVSIKDGVLDVDFVFKKMDPHVMGMEIYTKK